MKPSLLLFQKNILYIILIQVLLGLSLRMLLIFSSRAESKDLKVKRETKVTLVNKVLKESKALVVSKVFKVIVVIAVNKVQKAMPV